MKTVHIQMIFAALLVIAMVYSMSRTEKNLLVTDIACDTQLAPTMARDIVAHLMQNGYTLGGKRKNKSCVTVIKDTSHSLCFDEFSVTFETIFPRGSIEKKHKRYEVLDDEGRKVAPHVERLKNVLVDFLVRMQVHVKNVSYY